MSEALANASVKFDYLIIDEAGQATEPTSLIPFAKNAEKVILAGDHKQLQATVFS